jgi:hypothetical protein
VSYTTFHSKYVLHNHPDYSAEPAPSFYSPNLWFRNPIGVDARARINDYPKFKIRNKYSFINEQDFSDFNDLFDACFGRVGSLWVPSWNRDFFLTANIGAGDNHIHIQDCTYNTYYPADPGTGRYIFIYVNSVRWYAKEIIDSTDPTILIMESSLGAAVTQAQAKYVSILHLMRFDIDEIEWSFIAPMGTPVAAETEVDFIEVPHEYASLT